MPNDKEVERFNKVFNKLLEHEEKDFVKRIVNVENAPMLYLDGPEGKPSTHKMAVAESEGTHYVYPTILRDDFGDLKEYDGEDEFGALHLALEKGEAIGFDTHKEADWFERNWKAVWGHPPRTD
jgi:hypothetical protein